MTRVTKDMFSHLRISQQFFRAETEDSLVDIAEVDRDCKPTGMDGITHFVLQFSFYNQVDLVIESTPE